MENNENNLPGWVLSDDSEGSLSGFSESDIQSDRALSSGDETDSDADNANNQERWVVNDRSAQQKSAFSGPAPGPNAVLGPDENELDFFHVFFPDFLLEILITQTNLYARQKQQTHPDPSWIPVTRDEMKAWLGMRVAMSILHLPQTSMYWSTDPLFGNLNIRKVMKRDRFDKISQ